MIDRMRELKSMRAGHKKLNAEETMMSRLGPVLFKIANLVGLVLFGLFLLWLSRNGHVDFWLTQLFFDPLAKVFPQREAPLFTQVGHTALKWLVVAIGLTGLVLVIVSVWVTRWRAWRQALILFLLMVASSTILVSLLKAASTHSCPWDLVEFGGHAQWFPLFGPPSAMPGSGRCWPGGHASGGFALIAGYFVLREKHPRWARWALVTGLALGTIMSGVQMARGAHFLSHNLWTLWIVWATCILLYLLLAPTAIPQKR